MCVGFPTLDHTFIGAYDFQPFCVLLALQLFDGCPVCILEQLKAEGVVPSEATPFSPKPSFCPAKQGKAEPAIHSNPLVC